MGQIVIRNQEPLYCNLQAIQTGGSLASTVPALGEVWMIDSTNASKVNGSGKYDKYIVGDGSTAAKDLVVRDIDPASSGSVGTLNTNNTTEQAVSSSESLSGNINLHAIAKTGSFTSLNNKPLRYSLQTTTVPNVTSVGSASTWNFAMGSGNDEHTLIISGGNGTAPSLGAAITVATGDKGDSYLPLTTATDTFLVYGEYAAPAGSGGSND